MDLTIPDYAILSVALGSAVVGLFIGFSGALAFLAGLASAVAAGCLAWPLSAGYFASAWARGVVVGVAALLVFGIVRWLVKKFVHGLVAQPGDALLGMFIAALAGLVAMLGAFWGMGQLLPDNPDIKSVLLEEVLVRVGR